MISGIVRREDGNYKEDERRQQEIGKLCGKRGAFLSVMGILIGRA